MNDSFIDHFLKVILQIFSIILTSRSILCIISLIALVTKGDYVKREEQKRLMREKIVTSAIIEFNENNYESASMNDICKRGEISKGIIYHYFKDKDELYLECIKLCYDTLVEYYRNNEHLIFSEKIDITGYLRLRMSFFKEYPQFRHLFFHALLCTPSHLREEVKELQKRMDCINLDMYKKFLQTVKLRDSISLEKATYLMDTLQNMFNEYFRKETENYDDFEEVIVKHEEMIPDWIDCMLYGIAKED